MHRREHYYFVGIGGAGMSAIAKILLEMGYQVSGSDLKLNYATRRLEELGATIYCGHSPAHINNIDALVVSSAIPKTNPELKYAKEHNIPILQRAEMLAKLMEKRRSLVVAGTHGKTTTTSMLSLIFEKTGFDPTVVIGGELHDIGGNAKLGQGKYLIAEADESDGSFLCLNPTTEIITNIDTDHLDHYQNLDKIIDTFEQFVCRLPRDGYVVLGTSNNTMAKLVDKINGKYSLITFGLNGDAQVTAANIRLSGSFSQFEFIYRGKKLGEVELRVPGEHNILNALGAIIASLEEGISFDDAKRALSEFKGVERRFEILGNPRDIMIVDDYAHHPTEIKALLKAAKLGWGRRIISLFQPHRYTRTKFLWRDFARSFDLADYVIITEIYSAGEDAIEGVDARKIADLMRTCQPDKPVEFISEKETLLQRVLEIARPQDMVITIGAGDIYEVARDLVKRLSD